MIAFIQRIRRLPEQGSLTGTLGDGTTIDTSFNRQGWDLLGTINLIQSPISPVPEPSTLTLLALTLAGLDWSRRRLTS